MTELWAGLVVFLGDLVFTAPFIALYVWGLMVLRRHGSSYPTAARYAGIALCIFIVSSALDAAVGSVFTLWTAAGFSNTSLGTVLVIVHALKFLALLAATWLLIRAVSADRAPPASGQTASVSEVN